MMPVILLISSVASLGLGMVAYGAGLPDLALATAVIAFLLAALSLARLAAAPLALALAISSALLGVTVPALAQAATAPADPLWWVMPVVSAVLGLLVTAVAWALHRFLGIQLDRDARERLHMAMTTGASLVLSRFAPGAASPPVDAQPVEAVVDYVARSVPGAVARLAPDGDVLRDLAAAKLREAELRTLSVITAR